MILIHIDKRKGIPLYRQVYSELKRMISESTLKIGDRLPPSRQLAESLGINRSTIMRAYDELWTEGYLESRSGSYSTVRQRKDLVKVHNGLPEVPFNWQQKLNQQSLGLGAKLSLIGSPKIDPGTISFLDLSPDNRLIPIDGFRKSLNHVLKCNGETALQYGNAQGYGPLRQILAEQLNRHNITVQPDEILITNGAQDGIHLIIRALAGPGKVIITENPGYPNANLLFEYSGAEVMGIPVRKDGMDLGILEKEMQRNDVAFIYTMPNFHNPTGITTSQVHREKLLNLAENYNVPIIEDGFEEEMKYYGKVALPIKSMDKKKLVLYLGTFSKVLFPGIRIGWIAGERELINTLTYIKRVTDISSNYLAQIALEHYFSQGKYEIHLRRLHKEYRKRMQVALDCIDQLFSDEIVVFTKPIGGYLLWGKFNDRTVSEDSFIKETRKHKVAVTPGSKFYFIKPGLTCFRISIAHLNEQQISEGLQRLSNAINNIFKK